MAMPRWPRWLQEGPPKLRSSSKSGASLATKPWLGTVRLTQRCTWSATGNFIQKQPVLQLADVVKGPVL